MSRFSPQPSPGSLRASTPTYHRPHSRQHQQNSTFTGSQQQRTIRQSSNGSIKRSSPQQQASLAARKRTNTPYIMDPRPIRPEDVKKPPPPKSSILGLAERIKRVERQYRIDLSEDYEKRDRIIEKQRLEGEEELLSLGRASASGSPTTRRKLLVRTPSASLEGETDS